MFKHYYVLDHCHFDNIISTIQNALDIIPKIYRYYPNLFELDEIGVNPNYYESIAKGRDAVSGILSIDIFDKTRDACTIIVFNNEENCLLAKTTKCFGLDNA